MQQIDFKDEDTFVVAGLLKAFLRDLQEPLLTYELYDEITKFLEWPKEERSRNVKLMLREKLPVENYELFKYIVEFLVKVSCIVIKGGVALNVSKCNLSMPLYYLICDFPSRLPNARI